MAQLPRSQTPLHLPRLNDPQEHQVIELVTSLLAQDKVSPEQAANILQQMLAPNSLNQLQVGGCSGAVRQLWMALGRALLGWWKQHWGW